MANVAYDSSLNFTIKYTNTFDAIEDPIVFNSFQSVAISYDITYYKTDGTFHENYSGTTAATGILSIDHVFLISSNPDQSDKCAIRINSGGPVYLTTATVKTAFEEITFPPSGDFNIEGHQTAIAVSGGGISGAFQNVTSLTKAHLLFDFPNQDFPLENLFNGCTSLSDVVVGGNTSRVNSTNSMFQGCTSLVSAPFFDTSINSTFISMFQDCTSLTTLPSPFYDQSQSDDLTSMFQGCTSLVSISADIGDASASFTVFNSMFKGCTSLAVLPNVYLNNPGMDVASMFDSCPSLVDVTIDCSKMKYLGANMFVNSGEINSTAKLFKFNTIQFSNVDSLLGVSSTAFVAEQPTVSDTPPYDSIVLSFSPDTGSDYQTAGTKSNDVYQALLYGGTSPQIEARSITVNSEEEVVVPPVVETPAVEKTVPTLEPVVIGANTNRIFFVIAVISVLIFFIVLYRRRRRRD